MTERTPPALSRATHARFVELLAEKAGLNFNDEAHYLFERRLGERLLELELPDFEAYLARVKGDFGELDVVYDLVTTKETYFDRQDYQLRGFSDEVLPGLVKNLGESRRLTVWSAGCSTGEEAYTLAMLLLESPLLDGFSVQVIGTDLCQSNIEAAKRGEYRQSSFRVLSDEKLRRYFTRNGTGYRVGPELRRLCHFSRANLLDVREVRAVGRVDAIFCRNVLIYFHERARKIVTDLLFERLLPGGVLLLGHTESLLHVETPFEVVHLASDIVYRRPTAQRSTPGGRA